MNFSSFFNIFNPSNWPATIYLSNCWNNGSCSLSSLADAVNTGLSNQVGSVLTTLKDSAVQALIDVFSYLPLGGTLPSVFHSAAQYFANTLASVDFILPVSTVLFCMSIILSVKLSLWGLNFLRLLVNFVRGIPQDRYKF